MKAYTDIEQSKKLAEILPVESADMVWQKIYDENHMMSDYRVEIIPYRFYSGIGIPCWSLAALLDVFPTLDGRNANFCRDIRNNQWHVYYHSTATLSIIDTKRYDNLVDACVEMILKLKENNNLL